jgi:hypothetical protein
MTREEWLLALVAALEEQFMDAGLKPGAVDVSIGYTSAGLRSNRIGECWHADASTTKRCTIFIHPKLAVADVAHVLLHELIHATLGPGKKHGREFKAIAVACGLEGRMTATVASEQLKLELDDLLAKMPAYPGGQLVGGGGQTETPKQTTRMVKLSCSCCGYTVRTTQKWIDEGLPICPQGTEMERA